MAEQHNLIGLFEKQAQLSPDSTAVVFGDDRLTYRELREEARRVAGRLRGLGVGPETLVGMAFPRSADAVVCMLGIVLAGGAYLPVNPDFPAERLKRVLGDARPPLVVCAPEAAEAMRGALPEGTVLRTLPDLFDHDARPADGELPQAVPADALAYVMYTSGSTGRPKGVMVEHRGVVRLVKDTDYFGFSPDERFLLTGALEFDASTFEIWGALLNGAVLHIVDQETLVVPQRLKRALKQAQATVLWLTAPLFNQLVDEDVTLFEGLRTLLVGGDALSCPHVNRVLEACPGLRLLNGYGPTENTTFTTVFPVERPYESAIPIGRPIAGTTTRVLGSDLRPVPTGQIGELFTGGLGLARGYLHNPEATAKGFLTLDGERYYRTGDLVSADSTGVLSFHGRSDDQVKIRGHRVEVKEVNSALLDVPGVRDAHTAVQDSATGKKLIGYVVTEGDEDGVLSELRRRLPSYMCPERIVRIPRLPLNANGKVDTARLPAPAASVRPPSGRLSPEEEKLAALWAQVLHREPELIGPDSDFFELGGTSITAGALIGRIGRELGVVLSFQELFATRTLRGMARSVAEGEPQGFAPIAEIPAGGDLPLHPQQRGLYALWQVDEESLAYNVPARLDVSGHLDPERLRTALRQLAGRHDALRTHFVTEVDAQGRPRVRQVVQEAVNVPLEILSGSRACTDEDVVARFVRPFDLGSGPLLRALLVQDEDRDDRLYLDVHHIVFDGVSLALLVDELLDLYVGVRPEEPATTYAAAGRWLDGELETGRFARDGAYWLERFRDAPPPLDLPTDHPRPAIRSTRGAVVRHELGTECQDAVRRCAAAHSVTDFSVLLIAYAAVLARLSGQRDIVVGCPMSGRVHPDLDRVIGMFVNTVALRLQIDDGATLGDLLAQAGREHRSGLTHQAYPFDRLVEQVAPQRDLSRNALFDAFFALQNIDFHVFRKHGRRVTVSLLHPGTSRFDLNLQAYQRPQGLRLELEYSTALFTQQSAESLLEQIVAALDEVLHRPGLSVFPPASRPAAPPTGALTAPATDFAF
ncbi:putative Gramicidin S synthase 2 [Streptomyces afghaniensis 772]|uniref:Putative Gramicidin S synthase 2 n=1 Tax=Streptomyces afghaniensis 772 TaxID=1283301 RepID=S4MCB8_9ACTN|nr:non-ribosomal peptide synthetase [Streptomyces afghaniensis]EPJ37148.1 putative Gramicidin S synthase 2 [Streptomyces afghaniensis 772]